MIDKDKIIIRLPYIDKITISQKTRPKYYHKSKFREFNPIAKKAIPKRLLNKSNYDLDESGFIINIITKERVISNPRKVGLEKYWAINFQPIYNGYIKPLQRSNYSRMLKELIQNWVDIEPITEFPLKIEFYIFSNEMNIDVDNKSVFYIKCFQDVLTNKGIIPDDSSEYIIATGGGEWVKCPKHKERMEFHITKNYKTSQII